MMTSWPTPEWAEELSCIAKVVAATADLDFRDDAYQEIWIKFLRYPPGTKSYAWKAAYSARNSLWKREKRWIRLRDEGPEVCNGEYMAKVRVPRPRPSMPLEEKRRRNRATCRRLYYADIERSRARVRARVRAHRLKHSAPPPREEINHPQRNKEIAALRKNGMRVGDIGKRYGLNDVSIYAALAINRIAVGV